MKTFRSVACSRKGPSPYRRLRSRQGRQASIRACRCALRYIAFSLRTLVLQLAQPFLYKPDPVEEGGNGLPLRVGHELCIEGYPPVAFNPEDDLARYAHHDGVRGCVEAYRIGAYARVVPSCARVHYLLARAHDHVIADGGVPFPFCHVVPPKSRRGTSSSSPTSAVSPITTQSVIDEERFAYLRAGMYLYPREEPPDVRDEAPRDAHPIGPQSQWACRKKRRAWKPG